MYFNNSKEPSDFEWNFKQDISRIMKEEGVDYIELRADNKEDYYRLLDELSAWNKTAFKVSATSKKQYNIIIENNTEEESID